MLLKMTSCNVTVMLQIRVMLLGQDHTNGVTSLQCIVDMYCVFVNK